MRNAIILLIRRRKAKNAGNQHAITTQNACDNHIYENMTAQNGRPTTETPKNMVEMNQTEQCPDPLVYAVVQKNCPGNSVVQSDASAPASSVATGVNGKEEPSFSPPGSSIDDDTTVIYSNLHSN